MMSKNRHRNRFRKNHPRSQFLNYLDRILIGWTIGIAVVLVLFLLHPDIRLTAKPESKVNIVLQNVSTASSSGKVSRAPRTLYVSTKGSNQSSGDSAHPFKTIQYAVRQAQAGDTVLIQGGTYYERVIGIHNSGTATQPITIKATAGKKVIIDHGLQVANWKHLSGAIYQATPIVKDRTNDNPQYTQRVVVGGKALVRVARRQSLKEGTFWVDPQTGKISIWATGGIKPTNQNTVLINWHGDYKPGIHLFDTANHVVIDGLTDRGAETAIWAANFRSSTSQDVTIRNCDLGYAWSNAVRFDNWSGATVTNCNIHDTGLVQFPRGSGVNWPHAVIGFNASQITIANNQIHDNNGEGVGPYLGSQNWIISHNKVFDNWSVNIYVDTDIGNVTVEGNLVYNTGKYHKYDRDYADGIRIANENADILHGDSTPGVNNVTVTNNVILGTGGGIRFFKYQNGPSYLTDSLIANNTVHAVRAGTSSIEVDQGDNVRIANNLTDAGTIVTQSGFNRGIQVDHNLVPTAASVIAKDNSQINLGSVTIGNPRYTVGAGYLATNYQLQTSSPARGAGIALPNVAYDYLGNPRSLTGTSTIGAFNSL
jgi:hypothetical protein